MTGDKKYLAAKFEENRGHLRAIAYRMLGSSAEADDAVQEAWLRLDRTGGEQIENLGGWLSTVVSRVCLDMLRARNAHREESLDEHPTPSPTGAVRPRDPEQEALLADSVGLALMVVLDRLSPVERLAYVLHDMFDFPFEDIAGIVGRSTEATRQIASRARRRVRGLGESPTTTDLPKQRVIAEKFLAALQAADVEGLIRLLDPQVVFRADRFSAESGKAIEIHGAEAWAKGAVAYAAAARFTRVALVDGTVGLIFAPQGKLNRVLRFVMEGDRIVEAEAIGDPARVGQIEIGMIDG